MSYSWVYVLVMGVLMWAWCGWGTMGEDSAPLMPLGSRLMECHLNPHADNHKNLTPGMCYVYMPGTKFRPHTSFFITKERLQDQL